MAGLRDLEKMLSELSRGEKAQILKWVVQDLGDDFPGIDSRPDVCGGEAVSCEPGFQFGSWSRPGVWTRASPSCWRLIRRCEQRTW